jgi:uncharacterized membrane protein YphA (DoxX/SURF4 family)
MTANRARIWSVIGGIVASLAAGSLSYFTIGVWILFNTFWGCTPYHRIQPDPDPCPGLFIGMVLLGTFAFCLATAACAFVVTQKFMMRRLLQPPR